MPAIIPCFATSRRATASTRPYWSRFTATRQATAQSPAITTCCRPLASLAYGGRRRELFEREFIASLKLMDQGVPRWMLKGSWAGATGYPQFLPSVALRLRADGDGDGYSDIWHNETDGLASIASYLRDAGWKPGVAWGVVRASRRRSIGTASQSRITAPKCPQVYRRHSRWLTVGQWRSLGVVPTPATLSDNEPATLLEPDGPGRHRLSADEQLSRDPRLQLLEFLRDVGRAAGGRDCTAIDRPARNADLKDPARFHNSPHPARHRRRFAFVRKRVARRRTAIRYARQGRLPDRPQLGRGALFQERRTRTCRRRRWRR